MCVIKCGWFRIFFRKLMNFIKGKTAREIAREMQITEFVPKRDVEIIAHLCTFWTMLDHVTKIPTLFTPIDSRETLFATRMLITSVASDSIIEPKWMFVPRYSRKYPSDKSHYTHAIVFFSRRDAANDVTTYPFAGAFFFFFFSSSCLASGYSGMKINSLENQRCDTSEFLLITHIYHDC